LYTVWRRRKRRVRMSFEIGPALYLYTARNGRFNVWEGVVVENKYRYWTKPVVKFAKRAQTEKCPNENEIGHIQSGGPRLWLTERDDALAKKLFLDYELGKLAELKRAMTKKEELIKVLREE
jgi:hypothetical protein